MANSTASIPSIQTGTSVQSRALAGVFALAFGALLFVSTGFAAPSLIHNATHDTRHAFGLPCH